MVVVVLGEQVSKQQRLREGKSRVECVVEGAQLLVAAATAAMARSRARVGTYPAAFGVDARQTSGSLPLTLKDGRG